jgi:hypothetical protein
MKKRRLKVLAGIIILTAAGVAILLIVRHQKRQQSLNPDEVKAIGKTVAFQIPEGSQGRISLVFDKSSAMVSTTFECDEQSANAMIASSWLADCPVSRSTIIWAATEHPPKRASAKERCFYRSFEPDGSCGVIIQIEDGRARVSFEWWGPKEQVDSVLESAMTQDVFYTGPPDWFPSQVGPSWERKWD